MRSGVGKTLPLGLFFLLSVLDIDIMHGLDAYKPQGFLKNIGMSSSLSLALPQSLGIGSHGQISIHFSGK